MKGQQAASERLSGLAETVVWVVAFCFASTSMTMLNKAAVKALPFPYWLCVLQNIATILLVGAVVSTCVPSGHPTFGLVRSLDWEVVTLWLPAVAMFIVMLVSSLSALHAVSVPTVLVFRSLTPLCTAILESMWLRVRYAWATWASLTLILIGAVCYVIATPRDGDSANNIRRALGASPASILACTSARLTPGACAQGLRVAGRESVLRRRVPRVRQGHDQQTSALADRHGARREPPPPSAPPPRQPSDHSPPSQVLWNNLLSVPALAILGAILDRPGDLPRALSDLDGLGWLWVSSSMVVASAIAFTGFGMQKVPTPIPPPLH